MYKSLLGYNKLHAIGWMWLNCFMAAFVLICIKHSIPYIQITALITAYHFVGAILVFIIIKLYRYSLYTKIIYMHFIRSLLSVIAYFLYFHALSLTSISNVVALGYTDGIFTCLLSYIILNEHMDKIDIFNLVFSFIGALMIIKPDIHILNTGAMLAGISAILWSISNILVKIIGTYDKPYVQLFYSNFFIFFFSYIAVLFLDKNSELISLIDHYEWIVLLAITSSIQAFALFRSLNLANAGTVMPFFVISVLVVHIYGYIFLGETQNTYEIIGTICVIAVSVIQLLRNLQNKFITFTQKI